MLRFDLRLSAACVHLRLRWLLESGMVPSPASAAALRGGLWPVRCRELIGRTPRLVAGDQSCETAEH
jgi:hypothetical protein